MKAATEVSYKTPIGTMKPDALLQNGGDYIVETKLGPQAKLFDAMTQLYDYTKHIASVGGFAVLLPQELRRPLPIEWLEQMALSPEYTYVVASVFKDKRASQKFAGSLLEVADWISRHVLKPPEYVEPDTSLAISVLSDAVDYMTIKTLQLQEKELEDIFGGKNVFENILQYNEGEYPLDEMRKAATYLLINQILFYHVLSSTDPITFPNIQEDYIKRPSDLAIYFGRVLQIDYAPTFAFDVASRLPIDAIEIVKRIVKAIGAIAPSKIRYDLLGKIFHDLIPFETRKAVAAFYTNNEAAELLAYLSVDRSEDKVIDLACGSGTLLVAAYHRKRDLLEKSGKRFGLEDHVRFLGEDLTGIDIMPFAAHLAVVHLSLQSPVFKTEKVRVGIWDSTELVPGQEIPAVSSSLKEAYKRPTLEVFMEGKPSFDEEAYIKKGSVTVAGIGGEAIPLDKVDVVIMNPPFTRQERLPSSYKKLLAERLKQYKYQLHGQLGLWGYFLLLADRFVKKGGRISLVYPSRPLSARSAEGIRHFLVENYHVEYIITTWERAAFSESAQYREILLVVRKRIAEEESEKSRCKIVNLKYLPKTVEEAYSIGKIIRDLEKDYDDERIRTVMVTQKQLCDTVDDWFIHIAPHDLEITKTWGDIQEHAETRLVVFREYLSRKNMDFVRGVETKSGIGFPFYETFVLKDLATALKSYDRWVSSSESKRFVVIRNRYTGDTAKIPFSKLHIGIRRASGLETIDISNSQDYIIIGSFKGIERVLPKDTLKHFKRNRGRWKEYVKSRVGRFLISRRFDISAMGTSHVAFYSDRPTTGQNLWSLKDADREESKILSLYFNSTLNLLQVYLKRVETRGAWMEINKTMIENFRLLDLDALDAKEKQHLLNVFDQVRNVPFPSVMDQLKTSFPPRRMMDECLLEILGFSKEQARNLLDDLYPRLYKEILRLKELMAG